MELSEPSSKVLHNTEGETVEHHFLLPAVPSESSHICHMMLKMPSMQTVRMVLPESHDQPEQLPAWKYEVRKFQEYRGGYISHSIYVRTCIRRWMCTVIG